MRLLKHEKRKGRKTVWKNKQNQVAVRAEESKRRLDNIKVSEPISSSEYLVSTLH